jgi:hypothetical protein
MNVQFLLNEKGEKTAAIIPIEDWTRIKLQLELESSDFWEDLPVHVKDGIHQAQKQHLAGEIKSNEEVMEKYKKYI